MEDKEMPFEERRRILSELIATDIKGYADRFSSTGEETISDISYRIYDLIQMLGKLIRPYICLQKGEAGNECHRISYGGKCQKEFFKRGIQTDSKRS